MRVRIQSDGTLHGSTIVDAETGEALHPGLHVTRVEWALDGATSTLHCRGLELDVESDAQLVPDVEGA